MYTIGEFSRITGLTVKALRYYDEQDILKPSARGDNAYRLYTQQDFARARLVAFLRGLDFSIAEVREVLAHGDSEEDLHYYLAEKKSRIAGNVQREMRLMEEIELYLHPEERQEQQLTYAMQQKDIPGMAVAMLSFEGTFADIGAHTGTLFKEVKGAAAGPPFCLYHDAEVQETARIDLCVPVKGAVAGKHIRTEKLPAIQALCTRHTGPYETLNLAYKALLDHAAQKGLRLLLPWREVYLKGPGMMFKGNPGKYLTEIQVPFETE